MSAQLPIAVDALPELQAAPAPRSTLRRFFRNKALVVGGGILLAIVLLAVFAPLFSPYDPYVQDLANERGEMEDCKRWYYREQEAYAIQKQFLVLVGSPVRVGYSANRSTCDDKVEQRTAKSLYETVPRTE